MASVPSFTSSSTTRRYCSMPGSTGAVGQMMYCMRPPLRRYLRSVSRISGTVWITSVLMPFCSASAMVSMIFSGVL